MTAIAETTPARARAASAKPDALVAAWLLTVAAAVAAMVLVGGATRLTDSGLSITEWRPISGALPPLSTAEWTRLFELYKGTTEYQQQNAGMTLGAFEAIYWWEWGHRLLGRAIGVLFALPFLVFWITGRLKGRFWSCLGLFALGGLQGAIGWWMVTSGLVGRLDVAPQRLAVHLGAAFVILAWALWLALDALGAARARRLSPVAAGFAALVFAQVILGAFMAGADAGRAYTDWPTMGGEWAPQSYGALSPWWRNLVENHAAIQFNHRLAGYAVTLAALALAAQAWRARAWLPLAIGGLAAAQAALGIWTVLAAAPLHLALAHQGLAVLLWSAAILHLRYDNAA
jgi:cytochrome c oxidase assembly protein subunit 15